MLDIPGYKLIEAAVFILELSFEWSYTTECLVNLGHVSELHDYEPLGHVGYASKTHLTSGYAKG